MSRWTDIPGWDLPSSGNKARCNRFQADHFSYKEIEMGIRFFQCEAGRDLPLVLFLHGADAYGTDNVSQLSLHDVGTVFADPKWQVEHPCHILAPQYPKGKHWALPPVTEYTYELTMRYAERFHADMSRLYVYGYSAGGIGTLSLLKRYPVFAAAVPICGATEDSEMDELLRTPMWLYHAEDDPMVSPDSFEIVYYRLPHIGSNIIYERMCRLGHTEINYTRIPKGEMMEKYQLHPHCTWVLMGEDPEVKEWMFRKKRDL